MITVVKATGEKEPFDQYKVLNSIERSGINSRLKNEVLSHVESKLYNNIPTSEIYHHIIEYLGKSNTPYAKSKYNLKQAIMDLGPTGYPFEDYISDILKNRGYETNVRTILRGTCISHEIDVVAEKDNRRIMVEVKFHNGSGTRTDVQDALYTKARFDDVKVKNDFDEVWLVTNTKATQDAINYAVCAGMKIVSWGYPNGESLREMIEKDRMFPITAISGLSRSQKLDLLQNHIVACKNLCENPSSLNIFGFPAEKKKQILEEAEFVCKN